MADSEGKRATIARSNGQVICVTDVTTGRTTRLKVHGGPIKLECTFPVGMLVRRAELLDDQPTKGVES